MVDVKCGFCLGTPKLASFPLASPFNGFVFFFEGSLFWSWFKGSREKPRLSGRQRHTLHGLDRLSDALRELSDDLLQARAPRLRLADATSRK